MTKSGEGKVSDDRLSEVPKNFIKGKEVSIPIPFAKNCQIDGWWLRISLSDNELAKVEKQH